MAGHIITLRRSTILQDNLDSMSRFADELRAGGRSLKVAAEMAKPSPDPNRTSPMQRMAMAAVKDDTLIHLLEGDALPHHARRVAIESLLVSYTMKDLRYTSTGLRKHAETYIRSLEKDLRGMPGAENEIIPFRILLEEGCLDTLDRANRAAKDAKSRVEILMAKTILKECPDIIIVRDYLAETRIDGYVNMEV